MDANVSYVGILGFILFLPFVAAFIGLLIYLEIYIAKKESLVPGILLALVPFVPAGVILVLAMYTGRLATLVLIPAIVLSLILFLTLFLARKKYKRSDQKAKKLKEEQIKKMQLRDM